MDPNQLNLTTEQLASMFEDPLANREFLERYFNGMPIPPNFLPSARQITSRQLFLADQMTDSQPPEEGEEFIPNTQISGNPQYYVSFPPSAGTAGSSSGSGSTSVQHVPSTRQTNLPPVQETDEPSSGGEEAQPTTSRQRIHGAAPAKKKKTTSAIWDWFNVSFERDEESGVVERYGTCKSCGEKLLATSKTASTNNLKRHLPKCPRRSEEQTQSFPGIRAAGDQVSPYDPQVTTDAVPQYQALSRNTIRGDILKMFHRMRLELFEEFKKGTFKVALTSDVWGVGQKKIMFLW